MLGHGSLPRCYTCERLLILAYEYLAMPCYAQKPYSTCLLSTPSDRVYNALTRNPRCNDAIDAIGSGARRPAILASGSPLSFCNRSHICSRWPNSRNPKAILQTTYAGRLHGRLPKGGPAPECGRQVYRVLGAFVTKVWSEGYTANSWGSANPETDGVPIVTGCAYVASQANPSNSIPVF